MQIATPHLLKQLLQVARLLPNDQLTEVVDFAGYLRQRQSPSEQPARGSAAALLSHAGTLHFAPGELDRLLTDLADQHFQSVAGLTIENWLMAD